MTLATVGIDLANAMQMHGLAHTLVMDTDHWGDPCPCRCCACTKQRAIDKAEAQTAALSMREVLDRLDRGFGIVEQYPSDADSDEMQAVDTRNRHRLTLLSAGFGEIDTAKFYASDKESRK
jgi:hypothetical protein